MAQHALRLHTLKLCPHWAARLAPCLINSHRWASAVRLSCLECTRLRCLRSSAHTKTQVAWACMRPHTAATWVPALALLSRLPVWVAAAASATCIAPGYIHPEQFACCPRLQDCHPLCLQRRCPTTMNACWPRWSTAAGAEFRSWCMCRSIPGLGAAPVCRPASAHQNQFEH